MQQGRRREGRKAQQKSTRDAETPKGEENAQKWVGWLLPLLSFYGPMMSARNEYETVEIDQ